MTSTDDDFDVFLDTWVLGEGARYSSLRQNLHDPYIIQQVVEDSTGEAGVQRRPYQPGTKSMASEELRARAFNFFETKHARWVHEFKDYVETRGVPLRKLAEYNRSFSQLWTDGRSSRQNSQAMQAIKASLRDFDQDRFPGLLDRFVINPVDTTVPPLFSIDEMAIIFDANSGLIDAFLPDYVDYLDGAGPDTLSELYIRRGVNMPSVEKYRSELHYLSSYSLALGPAEQFAQTFTPSSKEKGVACLFSAPLSAVQDRIVAFAPFVEGMNLAQLEIVVAPPTTFTSLDDHGEYGGIRELSFS